MSVVNNVDVAVESDADRIRDALARQAMRPVRWVELVQKLQAEGVTTIVECGPGKVLTGLVKRIAPEMQLFNILDQASLDQTLNSLA